MWEENALVTLGVACDEDVITRLLSHCLNRNAAFRNSFVKLFGLDPSDYSSCVAFPQLALAGHGRPDLVVAAQGRLTTDLIVLENKLSAAEGYDQTVRYADDECVGAIRGRLESKQGGIAKFAYVCLLGDEPPVSPKFRLILHSDLAKALGDSTLLEDSLCRKLWEDWLAVVNDFYSTAAAGTTDLIFHRLPELAGHNPLDSSYLYFRSFASALRLPDAFEAECYKSGGLGRQQYGMQIYKPSWCSCNFRMEITRQNGSWVATKFHPNRDISLHLELIYNRLAKEDVAVYLHYETNPYLPDRDLRASLEQNPVQYDSFKRQREQFIERVKPIFQEMGIADAGRSGSNTVVRFNTQLYDLGLRDINNELSSLLDRICPIVDEAFRELGVGPNESIGAKSAKIA